MIEPRVTAVGPGAFEVDQHFYPRVPNARLHPIVRAFLTLGNERLALRYAHLHPEVEPSAVRQVLDYRPHWFRWAGADLLQAADETGRRRTVVIETNSCPSGQKSMPLRTDDDEHGGYRMLLERSFLPSLRSKRLPKGVLAVLCDKNPMETSGYAATLADLTQEPVYWVRVPEEDWSAVLRVRDGVVYIPVNGDWTPVRAAFRYITQKPWRKLPPTTRTLLFNPVLACLAGGRNKLVASKAYDLFNAEHVTSGLKIDTPDTIWDVSRNEVPLWVARMGGVAVVKDPYSNAGRGVWTITSPGELDAFMEVEHAYDTFIVQALVGNHQWTSRSSSGSLFHVGTVPNMRGRIHVADLRCMVGAGPNGFQPIALYARRARKPLCDVLEEGADSWQMLGTNLSVRLDDGGWKTESERLLLADERDFTRLGLGLDDLTEAYLQTCMCVMAIDRMCQRLVNSKGQFRRRLFASLVPDPTLLEEIIR